MQAIQNLTANLQAQTKAYIHIHLESCSSFLPAAASKICTMNIEVEYIDPLGNMSSNIYRLTRLAFVKHLAIAGQGHAPRPQTLMRTLGMFLHYSYYLQSQSFYNDHFSEPPIQLSDPTEKGQFSNIAGRAIADFLSKRIDQSLYTVNYEAEMRLNRMPIRGVSRPDLIAYNKRAKFAIEAKGYTSGHGDMAKHKHQSQQGGILVNFTVACVSYDLFGKVKCKYHDPYNENISYDNQSLRALTKAYYTGLSNFLNERHFRFRETSYQNEDFYEVDLFYPFFDKVFSDEPHLRSFWHYEILDYYRPQLILPRNILSYAEAGITNEIDPFIFDNSNDHKVYIDNDRIGLRIRP